MKRFFVAIIILCLTYNAEAAKKEKILRIEAYGNDMTVTTNKGKNIINNKKEQKTPIVKQENTLRPKKRAALNPLEKEALEIANNLIKNKIISYKDLIFELEKQGYPYFIAEFAAVNCNVDWKIQALKKSREYIGVTAFSRRGLIKELISSINGFTNEEAEYAANNCGVNWEQTAVARVKWYKNKMSLSYDEIKKLLEYEEFTQSEIVYGLDWGY